MLMPKRVKFRRQQRGRLKGKAMRGNTITDGSFALVATEPAWIRSNQIEAARIAMTRYTKRGGKVWIYKGEVLNDSNAPRFERPERPDRRPRRNNGDRRDGNRQGGRRFGDRNKAEGGNK